MTLLAIARLLPIAGRLSSWSEAEASALHGQLPNLLNEPAGAAAILANSAKQLTDGIALVPFLESGGPFGPAWDGHPFLSPAMQATYRPREPDVTRELAALMGLAAGRQGSYRAVSLLRVLTELAGADAVRGTITDQTRPTVYAEHSVTAPRQRALPSKPTTISAATRIDLLFEWPVGADGHRAVVVIEVKLGAAVSDGQLLSYRREALRRARGGPVALILLTAWADRAETRYRAWSAVRWFALLRRWEAVLAEVGDADPEFARLRAHLWQFVLSNRRAHQ